MNFLAYASRVRPAHLANRFLPLAAAGLLLISVGCGGSSGGSSDKDDPDSASDDAGSAHHDAGAASTPVVRDSGSEPVVGTGQTARDAAAAATPGAGATSAKDAGTAKDAGSSSSAGSASDAASDPSDPFGGLFPSDPAPAPADDGGTKTGSGTAERDVNGPCKDLQLICFDIFDMWANEECATCNSGMGCQGCDLPFAY